MLSPHHHPSAPHDPERELRRDGYRHTYCEVVKQGQMNLFHSCLRLYIALIYQKYSENNH